MSIPHGILYPNQQVSNVMVGLLYLPPDFKSAYGGQFCLSMIGEFKPVKLGANIEVPSQGSHVFLPTVHFFQKEGIFCHSVMSVKDEGI